MAKKIEYNNLWSYGSSMNANELSMQEKCDLLMGTASAETVQRFERQKQEQLLCTIRDPNQIAIRQKIGVVPDEIEKKVAELFSMKEASVNNEEDVDLKSVNAIKQEYESMNKFDRQNVGTLIEFLKNPLYKRMLQQFNMLIERQEPLSLQPIMPGGSKLAYPYYKIELIGTILRLLFELVDVLAAEEKDSYGNSQPNEDRTKELEAENAMLRNNLNELKENTDKSSKVFDMVSKQLAAVKEENDILKKRYKDIQNDNKQILAWQAKVQADCENAINRFNGNVATEIGILAQSNNFQKDRGKFSAKMFSLVSDLTRTVQKTAKIKSLDKDDWGGDDWD